LTGGAPETRHPGRVPRMALPIKRRQYHFCVLQKRKKGLKFNNLDPVLHLFSGELHQKLSASDSRENHERYYFQFRL
jgi:hypothetical protein